MLTKGMKIKDNNLYMGEYKLSEVAKEFKTPLYVYDEENIRYKLDIFKNNFKSKKFETNIVYASKAFLCPYLLNIINEYGMNVDSVSLGDLYQINYSTFPLSKVVLHGNNKTKEEIEYAVKYNIGYIVIDNIDEIDMINDICNKLNKDVKALLRVNPGIHAHTHRYIQTSLLNSKFGESIFDEEKIDKIINKLKESKHIKMEGFHSHIGSSINNPNSFSKATHVMLDFVNSVSKRNNIKFSTLNLGGGFGIKYLDSDKELNLEKTLKKIIKEVENYKEDFGLTRLMIEPGRSIVGDSGITLYTVGAIKETYGGKKYIFVDGGMTDNIRPALYNASYSCDICNNMNNTNNTIKDIYDIVGPCCESGDIVANDYLITTPKVGDTLITYSTGAYGYSMSSNYNGSLRSAVIFINKDKINIGIKREEYTDLVKSFPIKSNARIFDCHSDMLFDLWTSKTKGINNRFNTYHVPQLENSVIKGSIFTMYSPFDFDLIDACKIAINELDLKNLPNFKVILGLEGLRNLKEVEDLDILYNMGFRHAMLTWNEENKWATGAKSNPNRGLTSEGIKLVKKMVKLGMIVDLAHTNEKTFFDIIEVLKKEKNPKVIYSHGNIKSLCNHVRNVTDEQMKALKEMDGLLGLTLANNFVSSIEEDQTLDKFLEHVKYAINIMGIDNVCFGFDFMDYLSDFPNSNLEEVKDATFSYRIIEGLKRIGLNEEEIDKICYLNFYNRYKDLIVLGA